MPNEERPSVISDKIYFLVWLGLLLLTGMTISVAGMNLGRWSTWVTLIIAGTKSGLVLSYFMHLKYEKRLRLFKWMIPGVLALLILFIGLTFFDVAFR
jgi:cytochrome c oxidase subunit 4